MGCGTILTLWSEQPYLAFQYPLRAYGVWNVGALTAALLALVAFSTLCGPMGCGTGGLTGGVTAWGDFQYPLRAYGVWNG